MAYDPTELFDELESKLGASGWVKSQVGEPMAAPDQRLGAVIFNGAEITEVHGTTASGLVKFIIRFYYKAMEEPQSGTEKDLAKAVLEFMDSIAGDYNLGGSTVRNVQPVDLNAPAGFQTIGASSGGTVYRIVDLTVNVKVNDLVTWSQ
jgi:hypothetical protein